MHNSARGWGVLCVFGMASVALAQQAGAHVTADEVVQQMAAKNRERQAMLAGYSSERTYSLVYEGVGGRHAAEIVVRMEYAAPNRKHFTLVSETGSKLMCQKVLWKAVESEEEATGETNRMQTALSPENYRMELVGEEEIDGVKAWVLAVTPKVDNKFTYHGRVWVSESDYAVVRVAGEPAKNPSWVINHASFDSRYVREGEFWLPERNVSTSHVRVGGEATMTIDYGRYEHIETASTVVASTR